MKKKTIPRVRHFLSHFPSARSLFHFHGYRVVNFVYLHVRPRAHNNQIQFCVCTLQADSHCSIFFWFRFSGEDFFVSFSFFFFALQNVSCKRKYWIESNIERLLIKQKRRKKIWNNCYLCGNLVLNEISNRQLMALRLMPISPAVISLDSRHFSGIGRHILAKPIICWTSNNVVFIDSPHNSVDKCLCSHLFMQRRSNQILSYKSYVFFFCELYPNLQNAPVFFPFAVCTYIKLFNERPS